MTLVRSVWIWLLLLIYDRVHGIALHVDESVLSVAFNEVVGRFQGPLIGGRSPPRLGLRTGSYLFQGGVKKKRPC